MRGAGRNHPGLVRGLQRLGDLLRYRQRLIQRDRPLRDAVSKRGSLDQLQHQRPRTLGFLDAVDLRDVGVVEAGEDLRLPREPGEAVGIIREGVRWPTRRVAKGGLQRRIPYTCDAVRRTSVLPAMAGEASVISPMMFLPSNS